MSPRQDLEEKAAKGSNVRGPWTSFFLNVCVYLFLLVRRKEGEEGKPEQHERLQDLYKQSARQPILHLAHCSSVSAS